MNSIITFILTALFSFSVFAGSEVDITKAQFTQSIPVVICGSPYIGSNQSLAINTIIKNIVGYSDFKVVGNPAMSEKKVCIVIVKK